MLDAARDVTKRFGHIEREQLAPRRAADQCHQTECARRSILTPAAVHFKVTRKTDRVQKLMVLTDQGQNDRGHLRELAR